MLSHRAQQAQHLLLALAAEALAAFSKMAAHPVVQTLCQIRSEHFSQASVDINRNVFLSFKREAVICLAGGAGKSLFRVCLHYYYVFPLPPLGALCAFDAIGVFLSGPGEGSEGRGHLACTQHGRLSSKPELSMKL